MKGFHKMAVKDSVKVGYRMSGVGRVTKIGKSEGGWILGENGFYTADPKWVGQRDTFTSTGSTERVEHGKSVSMCGLKANDAVGSTKVQKPKKKLVAMPTFGSGCGTKIGSRDCDVGSFARTVAAVERDGFALFPESFNTTWRQSGDPAFKDACAGLQEAGDANLFRLQNTKTYKFSTNSSGSQTVWNAIKVVKKKLATSLSLLSLNLCQA